MLPLQSLSAPSQTSGSPLDWMFWQPLTGSQVSTVHGSPSSQFRRFVPVQVPSKAGLAGIQVYFQGIFLAPLSPSEPLRLTHGLQVVLGGYL